MCLVPRMGRYCSTSPSHSHVWVTGVDVRTWHVLLLRGDLTTALPRAAAGCFEDQNADAVLFLPARERCQTAHDGHAQL